MNIKTKTNQKVPLSLQTEELWCPSSDYCFVFFGGEGICSYRPTFAHRLCSAAAPHLLTPLNLQSSTFCLFPNYKLQNSAIDQTTEPCLFGFDWLCMLCCQKKTKKKKKPKTNIQFSREQPWTNSRTPGAFRIPLWEPLAPMLHLCFEFWARNVRTLQKNTTKKSKKTPLPLVTSSASEEWNPSTTVLSTL